MNCDISTVKILTGKVVLSAVIARIEWIFETFSSICLSFSGGKDSTVLFHLVADVARRKKRRFSVLFIDWEAQYQCTIAHILKMREMYRDVTETFYWVALPLTTVNGVSQFQPEWICWEPGVEWVRQPPDDAITDMSYFPFYRYAMTFEEFVPAFSSWFAGNRCGVAVLTGVRADESLNRFMGLVSQRKLRYADDKPWTTASPEGFYYTMYPLYDWKARDIWIYNARTRAIYNPLYDLMYRAGVPLRNMRVCEPFGPEQRKGLWLYHVLEPETWARMCERVSGAASGALYANESGAYFA
ncbi:phosphoadenosine phosphosulfate reductase family protein, partial [Escherichia coli]|nr:phosphoadenosine phosphosulfate reductase family protein [Escherichia coli]